MRDDVLSQIQARLPSLSKGQRKIAEYILSSYEKIKKKVFVDPIFAIEIHEIKRELEELIY